MQDFGYTRASRPGALLSAPSPSGHEPSRTPENPGLKMRVVGFHIHPPPPSFRGPFPCGGHWGRAAAACRAIPRSGPAPPHANSKVIWTAASSLRLRGYLLHRQVFSRYTFLAAFTSCLEQRLQVSGRDANICREAGGGAAAGSGGHPHRTRTAPAPRARQRPRAPAGVICKKKVIYTTTIRAGGPPHRSASPGGLTPARRPGAAGGAGRRPRGRSRRRAPECAPVTTPSVIY